MVLRRRRAPDGTVASSLLSLRELMRCSSHVLGTMLRGNKAWEEGDCFRRQSLVVVLVITSLFDVDVLFFWRRSHPVMYYFLSIILAR